ncbi:hypothetical protein GCM10010350_31260 [Streptomyces galilaeus]|nr:hypothetical protein GCM10010350_31260 [Streptomyces galilaeus]
MALLRMAIRAPGNRAPVVGLFLQRALNGSGYTLAILGHGRDLTCGKLVRTYFARTVLERVKADVDVRPGPHCSCGRVAGDHC